MLRTPKEIVASAEEVARVQRELDVTRPVVVMFVDLCGSTALKSRPQSEWLPVVCEFLLNVSKIAVDHGGRVVKYIGDEVMVVFDDSDTLAPARAETAVRAMEIGLKKLGARHNAKYVLDVGEVAEVDFPPQDVLGTAVDRCARIGKIAQAGVALASAEFVVRASHPGGWSSVGKFSFKGLGEVEVYRLQALAQNWAPPDPSFAAKDREALILELQASRTRLLDAEEALARCRDEVMTFRHRQ